MRRRGKKRKGKQREEKEKERKEQEEKGTWELNKREKKKGNHTAEVDGEMQWSGSGGVGEVEWARWSGRGGRVRGTKSNELNSGS